MHHFSIQIFTLDLLLLLSGQELDRVRIWEIAECLLFWLSKVTRFLVLVIYDNGRKVCLKSVLYSGIGFRARHCHRVSRDNDYVDMLKVLEIQHLHFLHDDIVTQVQFLKLLEVSLGIQELIVKLRKLIPRNIKPLKFGN